MKSCIFLFSMLMLFTSCNNNDRSNNEVTKTNSGEDINQNNEATSNLSGCYLRVLKRDTLALSIEQTGKMVTGKLSFDNFEKDGSTGTVAGTIDNNILKLIYSFQSEGMHSVMEIYFKITATGLVHGIGEVATKSDTTYYVNPGKINYPANNALLKISCEQLDPKYK